MTSPELDQYIQTEYQRTKALYSETLPQYIGTLALSQQDAATFPLNLTDLYEAAAAPISQQPEKALSFARTYGQLKVCLALDGSATTFDLLGRNEFLRRPHTEVQTRPVRGLAETFNAEDIDGPYTYVLADSGSAQAIEMSLIQALHMLDLAIVTSQFDASTPVVRTMSTEALLEARQRIPDAFLRTYGNVRKLRNVPSLLGMVVPTEVLEKSGLETDGLPTKAVSKQLPSKAAPGPRKRAAFIGITTAKRPHIGHGMLLIKAIADSTNGQVLIELNDQGPRVEQAIANLARINNISEDEAANLVSLGRVPVKEFEAAYKSREGVAKAEIDIPYALTANNAYYRVLFRQIISEEIDADILADSELAKQQDPLPGEVRLFDGDSGMSLVKDESDNAMLIEAKGKLTLRGVYARLSGKYALRLVDSPAVLTRQESQVLSANGLGIEQSSGINVLVDFENMRGTNGDTILLESLLAPTSDTPSLLMALRKMLDASICFDTSDGGICPNYASKEALLRAYNAAMESLGAESAQEVLTRPIKFDNLKRAYLREVLSPVYGENQGKGKATVEELRKLIELFPGLGERFSSRALSCLGRTDDTGVIPKNLLSDKDQQLLQALRNANPKVVINLLVGELENKPEDIPSQLKGTKLYEALATMGYTTNNLVRALRAVESAKGMYVVI